jgi:hypothetical protein
MPAAPPPIDFTTLDFTRLHTGKSQIYSLLKQAGRFALLDGVLRPPITSRDGRCSPAC